MAVSLIMDESSTPEARITSRLIDSLYTESMLLADEARSYFDEAGREERQTLEPFARESDVLGLARHRHRRLRLDRARDTDQRQHDKRAPEAVHLRFSRFIGRTIASLQGSGRQLWTDGSACSV